MWRKSRNSATFHFKMMTLYGIRNCDTVKRARAWLEARGIAYTFHDFRTDGLAMETLREWNDAIGWEALLNRRSRSWKELPEVARTHIDETDALRLMLANPTLIKRPVLVIGEGIHTGFSEDEYSVLFSHSTSAAQG